MRLLIQRVRHASVAADDRVVGKIARGLLVFVGIEKYDNPAIIERAVQKLLNYRVFADQKDKMNLSVQDVKGEILAISQFTLAAETNKGLRPSFSSAMPPCEAEKIYLNLIGMLHSSALHIATGIFGANMQVSLCNDGPVTFLLEIN